MSQAAGIRHRHVTKKKKKKKINIIKLFLKSYIKCISRLQQCFSGFKSVKAQHAKSVSVIACCTILCVCGVEHKNIGHAVNVMTYIKDFV